MITKTRRAVLAGATALATGAAVNLAGIAVTGVSASEPDPIFAAIERHRLAWFKQAYSGRVTANLKNSTPEHREAEAIEDADRDALDDASFDLLEIMPTSSTGMVALLLYVDQFNRGDLALPPLPGEEGNPHARWESSALDWPIVDQNGQDVHEAAIVGSQFAWAWLQQCAQFLVEREALS